MEIPPSAALLTALSDFTESRRAEAGEASKQEKSAKESQRTNDSTASSQRVQVSSERELQAAREAAQQASTAGKDDPQAIFRREAPTAGTEERHQPPGQIIDISV